ncbi:MAG: type IV pili methyl-accepting chemotaxis transducer N-terminal domain-containing protein [Sulfurospirillum sp.]|nr:type IV pili methyl-accepting chemotaxis transducer N-terminal domain-containing protein [Sulfurospirillum sp.]
MFKPSSIGKKLKFIGGLLSFIIISIIIVTVYMNNKSKKDARIINIAGKQRMLSQKMSKEIFYIKLKNLVDFRELDSAMDTFGENLNDLRFGNALKGIYAPQDRKIKEKLDEVASIWENFNANITHLKTLMKRAKPDIETLIQKTTTILQLSDRVVKEMVLANMQGIYIDDSGRQRMLSQRMGLFLERYLRTDSKEDYLNFMAAKKIYATVIERFVKDEAIKNISDVFHSVKECHEFWIEHDVYMMKLAKDENEINKIISTIYQDNVKLLNTMDNAVWLYTDFSESKNNLFVTFQYIALLVVLIIILYTFLMSKEIVTHLNDFIKRARNLKNVDLNALEKHELLVDEDSEDELKEASGHIATFITKVNSAMSHSQEAITKAEFALKELQFLSDDVEEALKELRVEGKQKSNFDKQVNATEDIAIESAESLLHVKKMLEKLQSNLNALMEK